MTAVMETSSTRRSLARPLGAVRSEGSPSRRSQCERGATIVEFALILPIFIALVFGVISFGAMLSYRQALGQAASEAARSAAIVPSGMATPAKALRASNTIKDSLLAYGVLCDGNTLKKDGVASGTCSIDTRRQCPSDSSRFCAVVTVTHNYKDHPIIGSFPGLGITLPKELKYTAVVEVN